MNDGMSSWEAAGCRNSAMALLLSTWIAEMIVCSVHESSIAGNPESDRAYSVGPGPVLYHRNRVNPQINGVRLRRDRRTSRLWWAAKSRPERLQQSNLGRSDRFIDGNSSA
jgi:hypothetical protein